MAGPGVRRLGLGECGIGVDDGPQVRYRQVRWSASSVSASSVFGKFCIGKLGDRQALIGQLGFGKLGLGKLFRQARCTHFRFLFTLYLTTYV